MKSLVRRFEFDHWSSSRRVVVLSSVGALWTYLAILVNDDCNIYMQSEVIRIAVLNHYFYSFVIAQLMIALVALPFMRAGREARWTAYFYAVVVGLFTAGLLQIYGSMSTPLATVFPVTTIILTLYFNERVGWSHCVSFIVALLCLHSLEVHGVLPYAPLFASRAVDVGNSHMTFYTVLGGILILTFWAFLLCLHIRSIRQEQESRLKQARVALDRSNQRLSRYLPAQLAPYMVTGVDNEDDNPRPQRRLLTLLFSDIKGFTHAADELEAEELSGILNEYLSEMMTIADGYGATVSQVVGDGMMILFGAPQATSDQDHARRAVETALAMQKRMRELQGGWFSRGFQRPFHIRIGINTGEVSVGEFGSPGRKVYSAVGVHAKFAERLQSQCEPGKVLISHATSVLLRDRASFVFKGEVMVNGRIGAVRVYEVDPESVHSSKQTPPEQGAWDWVPDIGPA